MSIMILEKINRTLLHEIFYEKTFCKIQILMVIRGYFSIFRGPSTKICNVFVCNVIMYILIRDTFSNPVFETNLITIRNFDNWNDKRKFATF